MTGRPVQASPVLPNSRVIRGDEVSPLAASNQLNRRGQASYPTSDLERSEERQQAGLRARGDPRERTTLAVEAHAHVDELDLQADEQVEGLCARRTFVHAEALPVLDFEMGAPVAVVPMSSNEFFVDAGDHTRFAFLHVSVVRLFGTTRQVI